MDSHENFPVNCLGHVVLRDTRSVHVTAHRHLPMPEWLKLGHGPWQWRIFISMDELPLPISLLSANFLFQELVSLIESQSHVVLAVCVALELTIMVLADVLESLMVLTG